MKIYRFIGKEEYNRLVQGYTLTGSTDWSQLYDTNSKGICFFAYNRSTDMRKVVSKALEDWLGGIVDATYIIQVEVETARKAWGFYSCGKKTEWNLSSYSHKNVTGCWKVKKLDVQDWLIENGNYYTYGVQKIF